MELVVNSVELPLAEIELALLSRATPRTFSTVVIFVRLQPAAAHEVRLKVQWHDFTRPDNSNDDVPIIPSNERYNLVRMALAQKAQELRLFCPVAQIVGHFQDGKLVKFELVKVEDRFV